MKREHVPFFVSRLIGGRPVRWVPERRLIGDYDGRERTLDVFNADPKDQRSLLDAIDDARVPLEAAAGGPLVIVFHSVRQSAERYADFVRSFPRPITAPRAQTPPPDVCIDEANDSGPHRRVAA